MRSSVKDLTISTGVVLTIVALAWVPMAHAADETEKASVEELIEKLAKPETSSAAVEQLIQHGKAAVPALKEVALNGEEMTARGWAIVCLSEIGSNSKEMDEFMMSLHNDEKQPALVRNWAAAARVYMTNSVDALIEKASLIQKFPPLGRPIGMRILEKMNQGNEEVSAEGMIAVSQKVPQLQQALIPAILAVGPEKLAKVLVDAKDQNVRRLAAGYLGTMANRGDKGVADAVIEVYKFDPDAKKVAWDGGPLFLPGINWQKEDARALVGNLIRWHLWCNLNSKKAEQQQIHNNLRSLSLARAAGYQSPRFREVGTMQWLQIWNKAIGKDDMKELLQEQGVAEKAPYSSLLN